MTDDTNMDQIEFWNGDHGAAWARHAEIVDVMFAEIKPTISSKLCAARADAAGLVNITFVLGDASVYPFAENAFDALVSRLGAMFFDDPEETFRRLVPALDPGGRIALGVWRGPRENLWAMGPVAAAREDPGPFSFADPDRVRSVLGGAGLTDIALAPLDFQIPLGRTLEEALNFVMEMGPLSAPLATVAGDNRKKAIAAITKVLQENQGDDGIVRLAGACWIITARTP